MMHIVKDPVLLSEHSYYENGEYRPATNFDLPHYGADAEPTQLGLIQILAVLGLLGMAFGLVRLVYHLASREKRMVLYV